MPRRRWTEAELRAAVAQATSMNGILRLLGFRGGSSSARRLIAQQIAKLGLDADFSDSKRFDTPWTEDALRAAVQVSSCYREVVERLGLAERPGSEHKITRQVRALRIDTSHFRRKREKQCGWTQEQLRGAVASSRSMAATLRALGLIPAGGNYEHVKRHITRLGIDTSHFTGSGWNVGGAFVPRPPTPLDEVLVAGRWTTTHALKKRLVRAGLKTLACELCGWAEARPHDGVIPVELDHVNGDKTDNRLENLRILCPNCHSLQPTHRGLNRGKRAHEPDVMWWLSSDSNRH